MIVNVWVLIVTGVGKCPNGSHHPTIGDINSNRYLEVIHHYYSKKSPKKDVYQPLSDVYVSVWFTTITPRRMWGIDPYHLCTSSETRFTPQCSCGSTPNWPGSTGRKTGSTHWMEMIYIYIHMYCIHLYIHIYTYIHIYICIYYIILYCIILYFIILYYIILYIKLYIYMHIVYIIYICSPSNQDLLLSIFHWLFHCKGQPSAICLSAYLLRRWWLGTVGRNDDWMRGRWIERLVG